MNPVRILIVDDEPSGRETLEALLIGDGYELLQAEDGFSALAIAKEKCPDLVLLDVMMPRMDGFELCRRIRADSTLSEMPILLVTALDDRDSRLAGFHAGADDFITKPFDRVELRTRVRGVTRLNRFRRLSVERTHSAWMVEAAEDGYVTVDGSGKLLSSNPAARAWLGLSDPSGGNEDLLVVASRQFRLEPEHAWENWPGPTSPDTARYMMRPEQKNSPAVWLRVEECDLSVAETSVRSIRLRDTTAEITARTDLINLRAAVSHELLTPLNHVVGGLDVLEQYRREDSDPEEIEALNVIRIGAERLQSAIKDLLDYFNTRTRDCPGGTPMGLLPSMTSRLASEMGLGAVELVDRSGRKYGRMRVCQRSLETVLRELLDNSRKFHPRGTPHVEIETADAGESRLFLRVKDDGVVMTPQQLAVGLEPRFSGREGLHRRGPRHGLRVGPRGHSSLGSRREMPPA